MEKLNYEEFKKTIPTQVIDLLFLMVIGLITLTWFNGNFFIKTTDSFFGLNPKYELEMNEYVWKDFYSSGYSWADLNTLSFKVFWNLLSEMGVSLVFAQKISLYLLFTLSMFSMYSLLTTINPKQEMSSRVAKVSASMFYVMNPFTLSFVWWHQMLLEFTWVLTPIIFALFIKILFTKRLRDVILLSFLGTVVANFLSSGLSTVMIAVLIFGFLIFFSYVLILRIIRKKTILPQIINTIIFSAVILVSSLWWLLPSFVTIDTFYASSTSNSLSSAKEIIVSTSNYTVLSNTVRLLGKNHIYQNFYTDTYYSWVNIYLENHFFQIVSFFIPIIVFSTFLFNSRKGRAYFTIFFGCFSIILLFLMKQASPPLSFINLSILSLPFGAAFRNAYDKFAIFLVISYSVLFADSINYLYAYGEKAKIKTLFKISTIFLIILIVGIYAYPFWQGDVIYSGGKMLPSSRADVPTYYGELKEYATDAELFKTIELPLSYWGEYAYKWSNGLDGGRDSLTQYFLPNTSIILFLTGNKYADNLTMSIDNLMSQPNNENSLVLDDVLGVWNIKYIILHNDWNTQFRPRAINPTWYKLVLDAVSLPDRKDISNGVIFDEKSENSIILINKSNSLQLSKNLTVSAWVKPTAVSIDTRILDNNQYRLQWHNDFFGFYLNGVNNGWVFSPRFPKNIWYYVVGTYDGEQAKLYVNGVLVSNRSANGALIPSHDALMIGNGIHHDRQYKGIISQVQIYNCTINDSEINLLYSNYSGVSHNGCLVAHYLFSEKNNTLVDYSDNENNGILYGVTMHNLSMGAQNRSLDYVGTNGELRIYKVPKQLPLIYTSNKIYPIHSEFNLTSLLNLFKEQDLKIEDKPSILFLGKTEDKRQIRLNLSENNSSLVIKFNRKNPTYYTISVSNAFTSYMLVFSESYDNGWKAFINGNDNEQIPEEYHFVANGFANGWYINKTGNYTITLEYTPQRLYNVGLTISATTFIILILILAYCWRRGKKPENQEGREKKNRKMKKESWNHEWKPVRGDHKPFMDIASHNDIMHRISNKFRDSSDYVSDNVRDIARKLKDFIASQKLYHYR